LLRRQGREVPLAHRLRGRAVIGPVAFIPLAVDPATATVLLGERCAAGPACGLAAQGRPRAALDARRDLAGTTAVLLVPAPGPELLTAVSASGERQSGKIAELGQALVVLAA